MEGDTPIVLSSTDNDGGQGIDRSLYQLTTMEGDTPIVLSSTDNDRG
jgi:hypothetical protein